MDKLGQSRFPVLNPFAPGRIRMADSTTRTSLLADAIGAIYSAGLSPAHWPSAVESIRIALDLSSAVLATPEVELQRGGFIYSRQVGTSDLADYQRISPRCVWTEAWIRANRPDSRFVSHEMIAATPAFERTSVYQEYFKPRDMHRLAGVILSEGDEDGTPKVGLHLSAGRGEAMRKRSETELRLLAPHLRRALEMNRILAVEQAIQRAVVESLSRTSSALAIVNRRMRVLHMTPRAEEVLARADGLSLLSGKLIARQFRTNTHLERLVVSAADPVSLEGYEAGGALQVPRGHAGGSYWVTVMPVPQPEALSLATDEGTAVVVIQCDTDRPRVPHGHLTARYRLTHMESQILARLVEGVTPESIAEAMHVSIKTVRMHLGNLFTKTGTQRQADLVRLAFVSAPTFDFTK